MKNIVYLDEAKLFSLSSQLFSGVTEYIVQENAELKEEKTEQKGPIASGRLLADAMRSGEKTVEKRVLHDFAYARFEDELLSTGRISEIDSESQDPIILSGAAKSFVKIKAKAEFFDTRKIVDLFSSFNKLGAAIGYTQAFSSTEELRALFDEKILSAKTKAEAGKIKQEKKEALERIIQSSSVEIMQDERFLESLAIVTDYGYGGNFEVFQKVAGYTYSAVMRREYFREPEELIVRKYSRSTAAELVLVGVVTQAGGELNAANDGADSVDELPDNSSMRRAILHLSRRMGGIERTMTGKENLEVVVDPIALYVII